MPHFTNSPPHSRHFTIRRGIAGVDATFDIVDRTTGDTIAMVGYWDDDRDAFRVARLFVRALNAFKEHGGELFEAAFLQAVQIEEPITICLTTEAVSAQDSSSTTQREGD